MIMDNISLSIKLTSDIISAEEIVAITLSHFAVFFSDVLAHVQW